MLETKYTNLTVITLARYNHVVDVVKLYLVYLMSTEWVDYVEECMKYQAFLCERLLSHIVYLCSTKEGE